MEERAKLARIAFDVLVDYMAEHVDGDFDRLSDEDQVRYLTEQSERLAVALYDVIEAWHAHGFETAAAWQQRIAP
jgi:hypothetical protein